MTNAFILCDLVWKVQKSHAVTREGSFNGYNSHVYNREAILRYEQTIAMIIELNHGVAEFDNDEIKGILFYISTIWILILSILFYFNKCTAPDQVDCECVCMNKDVLQQHYLGHIVINFDCELICHVMQNRKLDI